ncbi:hypothetical protein THTE_2755 [Thermogutta terrifontis]|uniref:Uncharacterized protein n=1 Tax=Thermogutta terrifontis TaxID=1331910 RepID=A0A286RHD0_9BACT|nr:hypothetical protein THTE_2755 [Thermogutta terrifontis]
MVIGYGWRGTLRFRRMFLRQRVCGIYGRGNLFSRGGEKLFLKSRA